MAFFNLFSNPNKDLIDALTHGDMALMDKALARGANAGAKDKYGMTPIEIAAYNGYTPDVFEKLIAHGANVNVQDGEVQLSPLMISAAVSPYREVINVLCENYAEIEAKDIQNNTALMWAISLASFSLRKNFPHHCPVYEIVEELIEWNADVNAVNKYGDSVFDKIDRLHQDDSPGKNQWEIDRVYNLLLSHGAKMPLTFESFIGHQLHDTKIDVDFSKALITMTLNTRKLSGQLKEQNIANDTSQLAIKDLPKHQQKIIKDALVYLRVVERENPGPGAFDFLSTFHKLLIQRPESMYQHINSCGRGPEVYLAALITSNIHEEIASGKYHYYEGSLRPEGRILRQMFISEITKLKNSNFISTQEMANKITELNKAINDVTIARRSSKR
ncbi:ankyrin repeat domain-containing protein [uncultured Cloacibacillus sp.]|uniref:ankyrin repeat domain-containing protein n=1 Tax=uncultured Cloacibacillus sp. TaxID=889794 RepID=UPI003208892A